jgi:hypothetical protein
MWSAGHSSDAIAANHDVAGPVQHADLAPGTALDTCPVCDGNGTSRADHNITLCKGCGHVFQSDLQISMVYDAEYAHQYDHRPHEEMSRLRWEFIQQHLSLPPGSKILDVGYGNGAFLKFAGRAGMKTFGIDLHGEDFGIHEVTYSSPIEFDLACFFDSIEHFPDFAEIFQLRTRYAVVSIPETPDFLLSQPHRWRHFKPGEHLHYFSRASLDLLFRQWGLTTKLASGHPEDALRGKLSIDGRMYDNIYTSIYMQEP